jgi:hypothetical protein
MIDHRTKIAIFNVGDSGSCDQAGGEDLVFIAFRWFLVAVGCEKDRTRKIWQLQPD